MWSSDQSHSWLEYLGLAPAGPWHWATFEVYPNRNEKYLNLDVQSQSFLPFKGKAWVT